jgi:hypothetical protein
MCIGKQRLKYSIRCLTGKKDLFENRKERLNSGHSLKVLRARFAALAAPSPPTLLNLSSADNAGNNSSMSRLMLFLLWFD